MQQHIIIDNIFCIDFHIYTYIVFYVVTLSTILSKSLLHDNYDRHFSKLKRFLPC